MHSPNEDHMHSLKRILQYLKGTLDFGLQLTKSAPTTLRAYTDAD